ncbi:MAG: transglutaminase domain-containing protein [Bacteroidota bacterium]
MFLKKIKYSLLILCFFGVAVAAISQNKSNREVDRVMRNCPLENTVSIERLAQFINEHFSEKDQKVRAIYMWVAGNIEYDVSAIYKERVDNPILQTRKGICQEYCDLFVELSEKTGVQAHYVQGYTKQNSVLLLQPHAWVAARIEGEWFFYDPTWGAGHMEQDRFVKKLNTDYYKIKPDVFIKTHMPFDPFWQLLKNPITAANFDKNKTSGKKEINADFSKDLVQYKSLDYIEQLKLEYQRIEENGICNFLLFFILREKKAWAKKIEYDLFLERYYEAQRGYEDGVFLLNDFITYRNNFFEPYESDLELKKKIGNIIAHLENAEEQMGNPNDYPEGLNHSAANLGRGIKLALINVKEHKEFVRKYIETPPDKREALFFE